MPFSSLGLSPRILKAIQELGYTEPTPIQTKAVPVALKGRDVIGIAQTGTGKTAAFLWPMLEKLSDALAAESVGKREPAAGTAGSGRNKADRGTPSQRKIRGLVLEPTRELAVQVLENLQALGKHLPIRYAAIFGGVSEGPQLASLRQGVDLIVATPGRLLDLMSTGNVPLYHLTHLVLDEADRMLDMGFLPDIKRIVAATPPDRQTLLFSATFSPEIERISQSFLRKPEMVEIGRRATPTDQVAQMVFEVPRMLKTPLLVHLLQDATLDSVLVFCRTKIGADRLSKQLTQAGVGCNSLHSNRTQGQRLDALKGFKAGKYRVLVATDIAARGIDVDGISHVVNYDFPAQPEDYVHRIGRTGRASAIGDAISFCSAEEIKLLKALEHFIGRGLPRRRVDGLGLTPLPARESGGSDRGGPRHDRGPAGRSGGGSGAPRREERPRRDSGGPGGRPPRERGDRPASAGGGGRRGPKPATPTSQPQVFIPKPLDPADQSAFGRVGKGKRGRR